jgi:hypothetical protein
MKKFFVAVVVATMLSFLVTPSSAHAFGRRTVIVNNGGGRCIGISSCAVPCQQTVAVCAPVCNTSVCNLGVSACNVAVCNPVCATPVAYPVLVPAFQFQYVPQTLAATVPVVSGGYPVAAPMQYPYAQPMVSYGQPQYQHQQQGFGLNNKDKIRELAKALLEEMNRISENGDDGPPSVGNYGQYQYQQPDLPQLSINAMARTCSQCHTGIGSKADMILFTQPGLVNQNANWKKIKDELVSRRMPPKDVHFQLTEQERSTIVQWLTSIGVN